MAHVESLAGGDGLRKLAFEDVVPTIGVHGVGVRYAWGRIPVGDSDRNIIAEVTVREATDGEARFFSEPDPNSPERIPQNMLTLEGMARVLGREQPPHFEPYTAMKTYVPDTALWVPDLANRGNYLVNPEAGVHAHRAVAGMIGMLR